MSDFRWVLTIKTYWLRRTLFTTSGTFEEASSAGAAWAEAHPEWNVAKKGVRARFTKVYDKGGAG